MRILILSRNSRLYSTRRIVEAARGRGHEVRVLDYLGVQLELSGEGNDLSFQGRSLLPCDGVVPRIGSSNTFFGASVVRQFESAGVYTLATSSGIRQSRDKLMASQLLSGAGLNMPRTVFSHAGRNVESLIAAVGGPPVVIKLTEGTQGTGVVLAESYDAAESVISAFRMLKAEMLVQEFVKEANGCDVRAFVVGGEVVAAMMRRARPGEFRANIHRGAIAKAIDLTAQEREVSLRAAKVLGLEVAGVDFLRGREGPLLLEVNSSPGLEGIEAATSVDVATEIIAHMERTVPTRDWLRQWEPDHR